MASEEERAQHAGVTWARRGRGAEFGEPVGEGRVVARAQSDSCTAGDQKGTPPWRTTVRKGSAACRSPREPRGIRSLW